MSLLFTTVVLLYYLAICFYFCIFIAHYYGLYSVSLGFSLVLSTNKLTRPLVLWMLYNSHFAFFYYGNITHLSPQPVFCLLAGKMLYVYGRVRTLGGIDNVTTTRWEYCLLLLDGRYKEKNLLLPALRLRRWTIVISSNLLGTWLIIISFLFGPNVSSQPQSTNQHSLYRWPNTLLPLHTHLAFTNSWSIATPPPSVRHGVEINAPLLSFDTSWLAGWC